MLIECHKTTKSKRRAMNKNLASFGTGLLYCLLAVMFLAISRQDLPGIDPFGVRMIAILTVVFGFAIMADIQAQKNPVPLKYLGLSLSLFLIFSALALAIYFDPEGIQRILGNKVC